jgi:hypothetical protein
LPRLKNPFGFSGKPGIPEGVFNRGKTEDCMKKKERTFHPGNRISL